MLDRIDREDIPAATQQQIVRLGTTHQDAIIRDLFETFLPEDQRVKRLGTVIDPARILALRGRRLFAEAAGVQCRNCHRIGNVGKMVGPDLTTVSTRRDRNQLLQNLIEPSKTIDPKYVTYVIETTAGRVHSGILIDRNDKRTVLRDASGKDSIIPAKDIELMVPQQISLMPDLLLRELTAQQVADLLEMLVQQKAKN